MPSTKSCCLDDIAVKVYTVFSTQRQLLNNHSNTLGVYIDHCIVEALMKTFFCLISTRVGSIECINFFYFTHFSFHSFTLMSDFIPRSNFKMWLCCTVSPIIILDLVE